MMHNWRATGLILLSLVLSMTTSTAQAGPIFYNGDVDGRDSITDENNVPINVAGSYTLEKSLAYDNFTVPTGQTWTLTNVFAKFLMAYYVLPTTVTWDIRTGLAPGVAGKSYASGDTTATLTLLNNYPGLPEYQVAAAVTGVTLVAGTYWLGIAPDSAGYYGDQAYVETTSGANASSPGLGTDGNSFYTSNAPGAVTSYVAASSILSGEGNIDFSMGINGTVNQLATVVPEPSSLAMIVIGLFGSSVMLRRRSRGQAA